MVQSKEIHRYCILYAMHSHAPRDIEVQIHRGGRSVLQLVVVGTQERMQRAQRTVGLFHCTEVWAREALKSWLWETEQSGTQAFGNAVGVTLYLAWGQNWEKPETGLTMSYRCISVRIGFGWSELCVKQFKPQLVGCACAWWLSCFGEVKGPDTGCRSPRT